MDEKILQKLNERRQFADNIKVEPYGEVKEFLDKLAVSTAKEAAEGMVKLLHHLGNRK